MKDETQLLPCPVCGSFECTKLFTDNNRRNNLLVTATYVGCHHCGTVYLNDRPPWKEIVGYYDSSEKTGGDLASTLQATAARENSVRPWRKMLRAMRFRPHSWPLAAIQKNTKRILDVGCGVSGKLYEFHKRGYEIWGIDVDNAAIEVCRSFLPEGRFFCGEIGALDLPADYFDYIRIDNSLEHVPDPVAIIRRCHSLLRGNGEILVFVPHGKSLSMRLLKGNSISSWIPFHLQLFTNKSLTFLLQRANFIRVKTYQYSPPSWLPLSFVQLWNRSKGSNELKHAFPKWLLFFCFPIGWIASKIGLGEELVGVGYKR